ncbi:MAG: patatin-like phospholipase family protein [Chloroflexota bacterium]|nr:patatin-like phospholipase family protein [Chloroflexota bacterium]
MNDGNIYPVRDIIWERRPRPQTIGLALGGGAARGIAHVGVLEVLEEHNIRPDYIAGASAGAVAGGLYAAGISARRMHELVRTLKWRSVSGIRLPSFNLARLSAVTLPLGLLTLDRLIDWLDQIVGSAVDFDQLQTPFAAVATDIVTGEMIVMNEGPIAPAIRASCSVPGVFTPVRRNDRLLVDGGAVNNLPVSVVRQMGADYVIAVDLLRITGETPIEPKSLLEVTLTALYLLIRATQNEAPLADRTITPAIAHISLADLGKAEALIQAGRAAAEAVVPLIKQDLEMT